MTASYDGVAKLGFGAMRLPLTDPDDVTAIDIEQLKAMVDEFIAKGGTYVDTAFVYHDGASETALREALVERYPRNAYTRLHRLLPAAQPGWRAHGQVRRVRHVELRGEGEGRRARASRRLLHARRPRDAR